jgi:hypothetical protein
MTLRHIPEDGIFHVVNDVRFEVCMAVTMKKSVFWYVAPCRYCVNRRFGGTYRLHLQGSLHSPAHAGSSLADFSTLKMEAIRISETSVYTICTLRHIPEDGIFHVVNEFKVYSTAVEI